MVTGVLFGGPTPEHDVSILTGLQALRELGKHRNVVGIYWTKTNRFYAVASEVEAEAFLDGLPKGSSELTLRLGDGGGFFSAGRRERLLEIDAVLLATHGGPGEDG
jgi:D-alanine-D-alanine ligase